MLDAEVVRTRPFSWSFRVNGSKVFPNPHADQYVVYVRYGPADSVRGTAGADGVVRPPDATVPTWPS